MSFSNDQFQRDLTEVARLNESAMPAWREGLMRIFSGEEKVSTAQKAEMLGVPGRRQFFKVGGATILGAAVLAACGSDDEPAVSGDNPEDGDTDTTEGEVDGGGNMDAPLLLTAISLENLAVAAYQTAADSGVVETAAVGAAAGLFMDHHQQHADALSAAAVDLGLEAPTDPNQAVFDAVVQPVLDKGDALTEGDLIQLAYDLEQAAAQTYVYAGTVLSTPALSQTIMTIGSVEARHQAILAQVLALAPGDLFPAAFYSSDNPLEGIEGAIITP